MCRKRSLTNEQALLQALRGALPAPLEVRRYVGAYPEVLADAPTAKKLSTLPKLFHFPPAPLVNRRVSGKASLSTRWARWWRRAAGGLPAPARAPVAWWSGCGVSVSYPLF